MSEPASRQEISRRALWAAWAVLLLIVAAELAGILAANAGHLIYTVDDAYIHLAMAENIAAGRYGVNAGEVSAASSSILWPILLAPFAGLEYGHLAPFVLNLAAALTTLTFYWQIAASSFKGTSKRYIVVTVLLLLIPATNLIGLIFNGMEHSLQVMLVAAVVWGLIQEIEVGKTAPWLFPVIVIAGLVRYENLAIALPALAYLFLRGYRRPSLVTGTVLAVALGAFSAALLSLGLEPLPCSVLMKSPVILASREDASTVSNVWRQLTHPQGIPLILFMLYFLAVAAFGKKHHLEERLLATAIALAVALHLTAGRNGYQRYEIYVCTAAVLTLLYLLPKSFAGLSSRLRLLKMERVVILLMAALAVPYGRGLFQVPLASNNIYEQHYQMHRFATEYYKRPVAVIDLGYVSYRNDHYVLDLAGLGSIQMFRYKMADDPEIGLPDIFQAYGVRLAIVFQPHLLPPEGWHRVARLRLGKKRIASASSTVWFYALGHDTSQEVRSLLGEFRPTLPPGVELVIFPAQTDYSGRSL